MMPIKFDKLLGEVREKDIIPQLNADPSSPKEQEAWVLKTVNTGGVGEGEPYGLLLSLTQPGADFSLSYQLSYRTKEGTTIRVALT